MVHFVIKWLVDDSAIIKHDLSVLYVSLIKEGQSVLHPIHIVAVRIIFMCVGTTRFLACFSCNHLLACLVQKVFQLEGLNEVCIPDHASILNANVLVFLHDLWDFLHTLLQVCRIPVHRCELLHCHLELSAKICCWDRTLGITYLVESGDRGFTSLCRECDSGTVGLHEFSCGVG